MPKIITQNVYCYDQSLSFSSLFVFLFCFVCLFCVILRNRCGNIEVYYMTLHLVCGHLLTNGTLDYLVLYQFLVFAELYT